MDSVLKKETIESQVNKNKIGNITRFVPFREDIENIYNAADLVVIPSIGSEAICRVAMEAMACGTPVIGANTGVIPELIPESNVFKKADYKAIVKKIINYSDKVRVFSLDEFYEGYMNFVEPLVNL
jgi:glycosyltransferase involved in cell wall biosynthesis